MNNTPITQTDQGRILSVDFFRGFTMFLLVANFGQLFDPGSPNPVVVFFAGQFDHVNWSGLAFWDLIQPFFMFIVGVSMPYSFEKRRTRGDSWNKTLMSALKRSLILLFLGWVISSTPTYSTFTNVLAQLSVTYFIAFLVMRWQIKWQLLVSFALIIFSDLIFRYWPVAGFVQPFTADHNFGSWLDVWLTGSVSEDRWVAFNAIPTTAHTIWGVVGGLILMKPWSANKKIQTLFLAGIVGVIAGYALGIYIPIIKRVCTSSFIIVSGGWALIALAFSYWLIDIKNFRRTGFFFAVVGMNPLFIYLFTHSGGNDMLRGFINPVIYRIFAWTSKDTIVTIEVLLISAMLWYICYFLYKRKIFIRI